MELFAHNLSILFDKIRFSEESFIVFRNKVINHVKENQHVFSFCEVSDDNDNVSTTSNSEEASDSISHTQTKLKRRKSDFINNQHSNEIKELK